MWLCGLQKLEQKAATREQMASFMESQRAWRDREVAQREREEAELARWLDYREARERDQEAAVRERRRVKNEAVLTLAERLRQQKEESREREEILQEPSCPVMKGPYFGSKVIRTTPPPSIK
jgi:adenylate kinase family enzyme